MGSHLKDSLHDLDIVFHIILLLVCERVVLLVQKSLECGHVCQLGLHDAMELQNLVEHAVLLQAANANGLVSWHVAR